MKIRQIHVPSTLERAVSPRLLALLGCCILAVFYIFPIAMLAIESLAFGSGDMFQVYKTALQQIYLTIILNSFLYGAITTVVSLVLAYILSYYIVFISNKQKLLLGLVIIPLWVAYVVRYIGFQILFIGPIKTVFGTDFGILYSTSGVVLGLTSVLLPFAVLPIYNALNGIDDEHIQASRMLGATSLTTVRTVILPLSMSGIVAAAIIVFILASGSFLAASILGGPGQTMIANMISQAFLELYNIKLASALAAIYTTILLALLLVFNYFVKLEEVFSQL